MINEDLQYLQKLIKIHQNPKYILLDDYDETIWKEALFQDFSFIEDVPEEMINNGFLINNLDKFIKNKFIFEKIPKKWITKSLLIKCLHNNIKIKDIDYNIFNFDDIKLIFDKYNPHIDSDIFKNNKHYQKNLYEILKIRIHEFENSMYEIEDTYTKDAIYSTYYDILLTLFTNINKLNHKHVCDIFDKILILNNKFENNYEDYCDFDDIQNYVIKRFNNTLTQHHKNNIKKFLYKYNLINSEHFIYLIYIFDTHEILSYIEHLKINNNFYNYHVVEVIKKALSNRFDVVTETNFILVNNILNQNPTLCFSIIFTDNDNIIIKNRIHNYIYLYNKYEAIDNENSMIIKLFEMPNRFYYSLEFKILLYIELYKSNLIDKDFIDKLFIKNIQLDISKLDFTDNVDIYLKFMSAENILKQVQNFIILKEDENNYYKESMIYSIYKNYPSLINKDNLLNSYNNGLSLKYIQRLLDNCL